MEKALYIFRLKHDVQNDSELSLAKAELQLRFPDAKIKPIPNLVDILWDSPLGSLIQADGFRFQDVFMRLPYSGGIQAYAVDADIDSVQILIDRLCYFRDFYVVVKHRDADHALRLLAPSFDSSIPTVPSSASVDVMTNNPYTMVFSKGGESSLLVFRFVPLHLFIEASDHVGRLARSTDDVDRMFDSLYPHFVTNFTRPYKASSARGFKWIEDFVDDRRAPAAYSTHSFFGLRGKFFPRMVHALLNYFGAEPDDRILDPFCGVGTLGVEASLMGLDTINSDINPLFIQIGQTKCQALKLDPAQLRDQVAKLLDTIQAWIPGKKSDKQPSFGMVDSLDTPTIELHPRLDRNIKEDSLKTVEFILSRIEMFDDPVFRDFARIPLAYYAKSMLRKYNPKKIVRSYWGHLWRMYYIIHFHNRVLAEIRTLDLGTARFEEWDVRHLSRHVRDVDLIITSPPYTTAIDYVVNDAHGMYILEVTDDYTEVDAQTIGSTKLGGTYHTDDILARTRRFMRIPEVARSLIEELQAGSKTAKKKASALAEYYWDMAKAVSEMKTALRIGGSLALIIGTEQKVTIGRGKRTLAVADSLAELGQRHLQLVDRHKVELAKTTAGGVYSETILIFRRVD